MGKHLAPRHRFNDYQVGESVSTLVPVASYGLTRQPTGANWLHDYFMPSMIGTIITCDVPVVWLVPCLTCGTSHQSFHLVEFVLPGGKIDRAALHRCQIVPVKGRV